MLDLAVFFFFSELYSAVRHHSNVFKLMCYLFLISNQIEINQIERELIMKEMSKENVAEIKKAMLRDHDEETFAEDDMRDINHFRNYVLSKSELNPDEFDAELAFLLNNIVG